MILKLKLSLFILLGFYSISYSNNLVAQESITLKQAEVTLSITFPATSLPAQELAKLQLTISGNSQTKLEAPLPPEQSYQPLRLVYATMVDQKQAKGKQTASFEYRFLSQSAGVFSLRGWKLSIIHAGERLTFQVPAQKITFLEGATIPEIQLEGPIRPRYQYWPFVLSLLLGALLYRFLPTGLHKKEEAAITKEKNPYEIALEQLLALKQQRYLDHGQFEPFYRELSNILREFLEFYMQLKALESTTEEFVRALRGRQDLKEAEKKLLDQFLSLSDLVKFAQFAPDRNISDATLREIELFILRQGNAN